MHSPTGTARRRELPPARIPLRKTIALLRALGATCCLLGSRAQSARARATARPWVALLGIPLAVAASMLAGQAWAVPPLALCAWWWAPRDWEWYWLLALGRGILGFAWAAAGAAAFVAWPDMRLSVGVYWAGAAAMLAGMASDATHRRASPRRRSR